MDTNISSMKYIYKMLIAIMLITCIGCSPKINEINNEKFNSQISYLSTDINNDIKFSKHSWIVDSVKNGEIVINNQHLLINADDSIVPYLNTIYVHSKITKKRDSIILMSSRPPEPKLKLFPYDLDDTLDFDNLRFLRFRLVTDSTSFIKVNRKVDNYICTLDDTIKITSEFGKFHSDDLAYIFELKPKKINKMVVNYSYKNKLYSTVFDTSFVLFFPDSNAYSKLDERNNYYHVNSLKTLIYTHLRTHSQLIDSTLSQIIELAKYDGRYLYNDRYYMNLGEIDGINLITVKDVEDHIIFERLIDGNNQRIEDFLNFYGYDELRITVVGKYNWQITIRFI